MKNNFLTKHPLLAVFLFTIICLIPEMLMRDFTPSNELRYLSIADEALAGGNFFAFLIMVRPMPTNRLSISG